MPVDLFPEFLPSADATVVPNLDDSRALEERQLLLKLIAQGFIGMRIGEKHTCHRPLLITFRGTGECSLASGAQFCTARVIREHGWGVGFEPTTPSLCAWRATGLLYPAFPAAR